MAALPSPRPDTTSPAEEELWLYGDSPIQTPDEENGSSSGLNRSSDTVQESSSGSLEKKPEVLELLQVKAGELQLKVFFSILIVCVRAVDSVTQSCSDDSDTDSDDVEVTIGDIQPSCMGPTGTVKGNRGYGAAGKLPPKGINFAAPGSINGVPVLEVDLDSFEEKPWRKPGADISDYFNYGFNEATWKVYCEKQRRLQLGLDSAYHIQSKENKIMVQQGRTGHVDKGGEKDFQIGELPPNNTASTEGRILCESSRNGNLVEATDAAVGEICNISRVEGRRWDIPGPDEIIFEAVGHQEYKPHGLIQHQQPPPPLPPPPVMPPNPPVFNALPPPLLFFQRPPSHVQTLPGLHPPVPAMLPPPLVPPPVHIPPPNGPNPPVTYNNRPPPRSSYFSTGQSGVNYHSVSNAQSAWVTTVNKSTSSVGGSDWAQRRQRNRELDRPRSQNMNYKSENNRYVTYNRQRSFDYERKHRPEHSWDKEERSRSDQSQKDRDRERDDCTKHKSSSRRKQDSEEKETHRRHKRKKSKKGKEEKSVNEEVTTRRSRHDSSD
ncbi:uncharacterized protein PAF06_000052 [Gastrophryne carolinensis]